MLKKEDCEKIVSRLINLIEKNINIIDINGVIIASSNPERVDTFHEGGRICASSGKELIIAEGNKGLYRGCQKGINLPIMYENKTVGVVGITGDPNDVKGYGLIVREFVELMLKEDSKKTEQELEETAIEKLIAQIITGVDTREMELYIDKSKFLGFDYLKKRVLILMSISNKGANIKESILKVLKSLHANDNFYKLMLSEDRYLLVLSDTSDIEVQLEKIEQILEKYLNVKANFIIGDICNSIRDYDKAFDKILRVLNIVEESRLEANNKFYVSKYEIPLLLQNIPLKSKINYISKYQDIFMEDKVKFSDEMKETIKVYFENEMNVGKTANKLYIHRNTVNYRLNKYKEQLGIDLNNSYECMKFYIAICLYEQWSEMREFQ